MKIKFKESISSCTTISSPYPCEIGTHTTRNRIACCGNCGRSIEQARFYKEWNYCPYCGEKIEWAEAK